MNDLDLPPDPSLRRIRIRIELALVEVGQLFAEMREGADATATLRRVILALGRISPILEDLDAILGAALEGPADAADSPPRASEPP